MSLYTTFLKLFKYNLETDKKNTFNIQLCLNDNWDKIENFARNISEQITSNYNSLNTLITNLKTTVASNYNSLNNSKLNLNLSNCTIPYITNVHISGTSGYILFSNKLSIQWGKAIGFSTVSFVKKFFSEPNVFAQVITAESCVSAAITSVTTSNFYLTDGTHGGKHEDRGGLYNYWFAIGKVE